MKKIINIFTLVLFVLGVNSCSLDYKPETEMGGEQVTTAKDIEGLRYAVYQYMKYVYAGEAPMHVDYQADLFNETSLSGNRGGFFYRWTFLSNDQDVLKFWEDSYKVIAQINFLLSKVDAVIASEPENADQLNIWKGEMYLARAMVNRTIALRFCKDYEPATADREYGIPIQEEFDLDAKPGRGTLAATYTAITGDITKAETLLAGAEGEENSMYLNSDCVSALKAQVALDMHDYTGAVSAADEVIDLYPLVTTKADLQKMWLKDEASEIIFKVAFSKTEVVTECNYTDYLQGVYVGQETIPGTSYTYDYENVPAYSPEQWVSDLYDSKDFRYGVYISPSYISNGGGTEWYGYLVNKFIGNETLRTTPTTLNYQSQPKVLRTADLVLIKAEAQYRQGGAEEGNALATLNELRTARGLDELNGVTGDALFKAIKEERVREMIGEGGRIADLKRWNDGFIRNAGVALWGQISLGVLGGHTMTQEAGANKFLWPIPQREFGANPSLVGQQNPGFN